MKTLLMQNNIEAFYRFLLTVLILFSLVLLSRSVSAENVQVNGVNFPGSYTASQVTLKLRGAAMLRWAMMVDLYAGALYLPEDVPSQKWPEDVPKLLELSYFREIPAKGFVESSQDHLQSTLSPDYLGQIQSRLRQLYLLFQDVGPGDRYTLSYQPEVGTSLSLNGKVLGTIPGVDFAAAYFSIWLGEKPLNKKFRDQVLGFSAS